MKILVTGASGLLGVNLAYSAGEAHQVFGVVNQHILRGVPFEVIQSDLILPGELEKVIKTTQPDWIINCAALADVDKCEDNPEMARKVNVELPAKMARLCGKTIRLLHISTDAVFDGQRGGYTESDEPNPLSVYARTKLDGEKAVLDACPAAVIARINIFGWSASGKRSLAEWFFYNLQARNPVKGFTDVYFCPLLVNNLAGVLLEMLDKGISGLYHAVGADCLTKYEFGVRIARRFGLDEGLISPVSVDAFGLKATRAHNLCLSTQKLSTALRRSLPRLSTGLDGFFDLYQQGYPQLIRETVDNHTNQLNPYIQGGSDGN